MKACLLYLLVTVLCVSGVNAGQFTAEGSLAGINQQQAFSNQSSPEDCHPDTSSVKQSANTLASNTLSQLNQLKPHDCCNDNSITQHCLSSCDNCCDNVNSSSVAIVSSDRQFNLPHSSEQIVSNSQLPFPPSQNELIPPIS